MKENNPKLRVALTGFSSTEARSISSSDLEVCALLFLRDGKESSDGLEFPYAEFKKAKWTRCLSEVEVPDEIITRAEHVKPKFIQCFHRWPWSHELLDETMDADAYFYQSVANSWRWLSKSKPNLLVFSNVPHEGAIVVLYEVAKLMNISTLVCWQGIVTGYMWMFDHWSDLGKFSSTPPCKELDLDISKPTEKPFYMAGVKSSRQLRFASQKDLLVYGLKTALYSFLPKTSFGPAFRRNAAKLKISRQNAKYFKKRDQLFAARPEDLENEEFVYFPLHLEPEMEVDLLGGNYDNQILAIQELRKKLPRKVKIVVKDHPYQDSRKRDDFFFEKLGVEENVILANSEVSSALLIEKSVATATVCGTAGWEALRTGKPVIVFGYAFWNQLPGAFNIKDRWDYKKIKNFTQDVEAFSRAVRDMSKHAWPGLVDHYYIRNLSHFDPIENSKNVSSAIKAFATYNKIKSV